MLGTTVGHYRIDQKLGEGGMGVVYKATDTSLGRAVALKFISPAASSDDAMKQRLIREAKACAALNHPNVTTVYEFVQTDEYQFIAMEFVEGETLDKKLQGSHLQWQEALPFMLQLLDGVEAAHKRGIVHRDLKASNIMLDAGGHPKIMDFGLAKFAQGSMLTQSGSTVGTAAYMSPEQARGEETDQRTDIYSLGVVFYQILTGCLPFVHEHQLAILYAVVNEPPRPPREVDPSIPPALERIVLKAMAKNVEERFQSCVEMARSILEIESTSLEATSLKSRFRHLLDSSEASAGATGTVQQNVTRSRVARYGLVAIAVLIAAGVMILLIPSRSGDQEESRRLAKAHHERARTLMKENNAALAARELELAIENDSTYAAAWSDLSVLSIHRRENELAVDQARKAVQYDKSPLILYNLAYALEEAGNDNEALTWYREAIEKDSSFAEAFCALANLYVRTGKAGDAIKLLTRCEQIHPSSPQRFRLYRNLARAYLALRQPEKAKEAVEQSLQLMGEEAETLFLLASIFDTLRLEKESLVRWKEYLSIEKDPAKQARALLRIEQLKKKLR